MKIIMFNYSEITSPGGVHKTIRELAKNLSKKGHKITVIQSNPFNLKKEQHYDGYKIIRINSRLSKYLYGFVPEIYNYLKEELDKINPDIIHIHGYHTLFTPLVLFTILKINPEIPIIFSPYLDVIRSTIAGKYLWKIYKIIGKQNFEKSSQIIACSNFEARCISENFKIINNNIFIIPLGVDLYNITKNPRNDSEVNLIYAGHLIKRKGIDFILLSMDKLINDLKINNVKLTIIGEGKEKKNLLKLASRLKIDDYIIWKPFLSRDELIQEIKNSDIFMLLSRSEAFGIVVAESLALGTCCIVTNKTALTEFNNENGCFGVNYPPNPKEVANLINRIYNENVKVGPLTNKIRTWNEVTENYEKIYKSYSELNED